jgi:hypothetical protein
MAQPQRKHGSKEPTKHPTPYARVAYACLRKNIRQARGLQPPWMRGKSSVSYGWKFRTSPKKRDGCVGGGSGSPRLRRQRGHSFSTFCEGLDSCRIMDYTAAIPYRYEVCRHCEAGMADDCAAEAPWDPFTRTPEPCGRWKRPLHDTLHLPRPEKHAVRRVRLHTPSTRQHQRSGREHRCYDGGASRSTARKIKGHKVHTSTLSAGAALGRLR